MLDPVIRTVPESWGGTSVVVTSSGSVVVPSTVGSVLSSSGDELLSWLLEVPLQAAAIKHSVRKNPLNLAALHNLNSL
ncbi:MAG: hypothetical protein ACR2NL_01130 [Acidimicrobiia bacterium]